MCPSACVPSPVIVWRWRLTVVLLPVDQPRGGQRDEGLSVLVGHRRDDHLERAQCALGDWEQTGGQSFSFQKRLFFFS